MGTPQYSIYNRIEMWVKLIHTSTAFIATGAAMGGSVINFDQCYGWSVSSHDFIFHYIILFYLIWRISTHGLLFTTYLILHTCTLQNKHLYFTTLCKSILLYIYIICEQHLFLENVWIMLWLKTCEHYLYEYL